MEKELDAELRFHFELLVTEKMRLGLTEDQARRQARLEFGGLEQVKEDCRERRGTLWLASLVQDLHFALRQLRSSPGFAIIAALALSLGIGATAAIFSVMDAVILRPLPFAHQERLLVPLMTSRSGYPQSFSYPGYLDFRTQLQTFDVLAGYAGGIDKVNLEGPIGPVSLRLIKGTDNFFDVFGAKPLLGRTYLPGEDQPGRDNVAVLSYQVWKADFAGRADAVGKMVRLGGTPYTVIGVMPAGFRFPLSAQDVVYTPLHPIDAWRTNRGPHWMRTVGLVKIGVSRDAALADFNRVVSNIGRAYPDADGGLTGSLISLAQQVNTLDSGQNVTGTLRALALACLALLGIACINVAGLLLARGVKRDREMALRAAVGANRGRLMRQMVTESLVLGVSGLGGGLLASLLLLKVMNVFLVKAMARGADVHLNMTMVTVALVVSLLSSTLASIAPAVRLSGTDPNRALRASGVGASSGRGQHRMRSAFVIVQIALSLVLLVVSGLLLRNLSDLLRTDLGFHPSRILAMEIDLSPGRYQGRDPVTAFYRPLLEKLAHLPGVEGAGVIDNLPVESWGSSEYVHIAGQPPYPPNQQKLSELRFISEGYFDAMGIKLVRGRLTSPQLDRVEINPGGTVVVNEAFRREFFPNGGNPVGAFFDNDPGAKAKTSIVGLVTNVRQDLRQQPMAELDFLLDELPAKLRLDYLGNMTLVIRANGDPSALIPSLHNALHEVDPTVPFQAPESMTQIVSEQLIFERMESWLFGIFAAFALLLASIGLYGLLNHEVELRTREIGIRMALGSTRGLVMRHVVRRVALLMATGLGFGWLLTLALRKVMASVVEMHSGHDFALLAGLTAGLAATGILAGLVPARRASCIEPMRSLRTE
jgi:putative ABC transport system permease protein